ncbi:unnamed protein product [Rangifer tarandus platyrhynchus]|uniref:Uncharacterized protein n=1 Tax=Rangifer tarandus platyrhynchus TaxID=3082113 RepID=A0AC59Y4G2_RANTA
MCNVIVVVCFILADLLVVTQIDLARDRQNRRAGRQTLACPVGANDVISSLHPLLCFPNTHTPYASLSDTQEHFLRAHPALARVPRGVKDNILKNESDILGGVGGERNGGLAGKIHPLAGNFCTISGW